jgi:hypothetical protein
LARPLWSYSPFKPTRSGAIVSLVVPAGASGVEGSAATVGFTSAFCGFSIPNSLCNQPISSLAPITLNCLHHYGGIMELTASANKKILGFAAAQSSVISSKYKFT